MEKHESAIKKLMTTMVCPKDFKCVESAEHCCKVKDIGLEDYIKCLGKNPSDCKFLMPFGDIKLCNCSLGTYLTKRATQWR